MHPERERLLHDSYHRRTGRTLAQDAGNAELYDAPAVILMHGTQTDPLFCYANRTAQTLWGYTWDEFLALPSRLSAEPDLQSARELLLARARANGFIDDYSGIRIARDNRRFHISGVVLWTVDDASGNIYGQAAVFRTWTML